MSKTTTQQIALQQQYNDDLITMMQVPSKYPSVPQQDQQEPPFLKRMSSSCSCTCGAECCTCNNFDASSSSAASCCSASSNNNSSPYSNFTQDIQGPTFVPVFSSVQGIYPNHNSSAKGQVPWKCSRCSNDSFGHKCQRCHLSRDAAALRVFMGQLTKEGDVQLIQKMLEVLCPELNLSRSLLHIEPHTHAHSGRGKGCAWVYVSSLHEVMYIVKRLHKRTYPTVNAQTGEVGFVAFPDSSFTQEDIKRAFDNDVTFLSENVLPLFHRSPITAEVPLSLQRALNIPNNTATFHHNNNNHHSSSRAPVQQQQQQQVITQNNNTTTPIVNKQGMNNMNNDMMKVSAYQAPSNTVQQVNETTTPEVVSSASSSNASSSTNNDKKKSSNLNRYRWNPYSMSKSRILVH